MRELVSRAEISGILDAALSGAQVTAGAEAELQKELKLDSVTPSLCRSFGGMTAAKASNIAPRA